MGRIGPTSVDLLKAVEQAYDRLRGTWTGCDWPTSFGDSGLDLNGLTSYQALLMSRATAGSEAADWREAVHWLRMVEADAEAAEDAARWVVQHVQRGDLAAARREAQAACELESRHHSFPVWSEVWDIVASPTRVPASCRSR